MENIIIQWLIKNIWEKCKKENEINSIIMQISSLWKKNKNKKGVNKNRILNLNSSFTFWLIYKKKYEKTSFFFFLFQVKSKNNLKP